MPVMSSWPTFGEISPDYGGISEEDVKENSIYVIDAISNPDSVLHDSTFHDSGLSLDHGRIATTVSIGLEGPSMSLTPPASPDQPLMQDSLKDVTVDVPSHEIGSKSLASKKKKFS